jgi:hypothetical protein
MLQHIFKRVLCVFKWLTDRDINLRMSEGPTNLLFRRPVTMNKIRYHSIYFVKYLSCPKMFQVRVMDHNGVCIHAMCQCFVR